MEQQQPFPGASMLPKFKNLQYSRPYIEKVIRGQLIKLSHKTTELARKVLNDKEYSLEPHRPEMKRCFESWLKYWCEENAFINEFKWVDLPPLATSTEEDLTVEKKRRLKESTAMLLMPEMARLFFLYFHGIEWCLNDSVGDFWLDGGWNELEVNPPSMDQESKALKEMRTENERRKREEEEKGKVEKDVDKPKETPEERYLKAFDAVPPPRAAVAQEEEAAPPTNFQEFKRNLLWFRNVSSYTQRNLYDSVMLLIEKINDYPLR